LGLSWTRITSQVSWMVMLCTMMWIYETSQVLVLD
jgi:hypothetical protein